MTRSTRLKILLILLGTLLVATGFAAEDSEEKLGELRISRSITQNSPTPATEETLNQAFENAIPNVELALSTRTRIELGNKTLRSHFSLFYWLRDLYTELSNDFDRDGFYQRFTLNFLPDLNTGFTDIYADIYLSHENADWDFLTSTNDQRIFAGGFNDYFRITTQLDSGYPTGYYDVLIELRDSRNGRLLASFDPSDSASLNNLPLEDNRRDNTDSHLRTDVQISGTGSLGLIGLLALLGMVYIRKISVTQHSQRHSLNPLPSSSEGLTRST